MFAMEKDRSGGSFGELRSKHLPMFDEKLHRHDRGWPHETPDPQTSPASTWETRGIFHFRRRDAEEEG